MKVYPKHVRILYNDQICDNLICNDFLDFWSTACLPLNPFCTVFGYKKDILESKSDVRTYKERFKTSYKFIYLYGRVSETSACDVLNTKNNWFLVSGDGLSQDT